MRRASILGGAMSVVVAIVLTVSTAPTLAAEPISDWKIEPSDVRCVAVRKYGTTGRPITLALKASLIDDAVQLAIIRQGLRATYVQSGAILEIDDREVRTSALSYPTGGDKRRVTHLINIAPEPALRLRQAKVLKVIVHEGTNDSFPLEPSAAAWKGLEDCTARLRETWNVGDERQRIAKHAEGDLVGLFSSDDYPLVAQMQDQQGTTAFLLLIDEEGVAKDCTVTVSSGSAAIDSRSCGIILARGKFSPAIGADGKPTKSAYIKRITWSLE